MRIIQITALILFLSLTGFPAKSMAGQRIPGIPITLDELDLPKMAVASRMIGSPVIESIQDKQITLVKATYSAQDPSKALIRLRLIVPAPGAPGQSVPGYFNEIKTSRLERAKQKENINVYTNGNGKDFDVEYDNKERSFHYRHVGLLDDTAAYYIDAITTLGKTVDSTVQELEKAAKSATLYIMLAQQENPAKGTEIPGHNLTVPSLSFPEKIGDMKMHGDPRLTSFRERFATRLNFVYWNWQAQATVFVDLYIPAPGSTDPDTAPKLLWEDYQYELQHAPTRGFKVVVDSKSNNGFTLEKERKGQLPERHHITGVIKDRYGYKITLVERGGPVVDYGMAGLGLRGYADAALDLLRLSAGPQLSGLKRDQFEPGIEECYNDAFPKLPRANLHVDNRSRFKILLATAGSDIEVNDRRLARVQAMVTIEPKTTRIIYHALPSGRAEVSADPEEWQGKTKIAKWTKLILNNEQETCGKMYALLVTDADLTMEEGPKGGWHEQTPRSVENPVTSKPIPGDWETVVQ